MPNSITNRQMVFILLLTLTSSTIVDMPKVMAESAGTGSWATILLASILFALVAYLWVSLNNMFQGKMLFEYSKELLGKAAAYFLAVYYSQYFITVLVTLNISMSNLLKANFLPNTPVWATMLAALSVLGFVAYKGITNTARLVEIYGVIFIIVVVSVHIVMLVHGNPNHVLPLYNPAETGRVISAVKETIFPFLGIEVLSVIPFTMKNGPKAAKTAILTLLGIGLFYILVVETSIMMVGFNEITQYNYPMIVAIRQVELPSIKIFQRIDLLFLTVGFIGLLAGNSIIYVNIVEYICRMLPKVRRVIVVLAVGLAAFLAGYALQGINEIYITLRGIITASGVAVTAIIPLILFLIAKVKNHGKKNNA